MINATYNTTKAEATLLKISAKELSVDILSEKEDEGTITFELSAISNSTLIRLGKLIILNSKAI